MMFNMLWWNEDSNKGLGKKIANASNADGAEATRLDYNLSQLQKIEANKAFYYTFYEKKGKVIISARKNIDMEGICMDFFLNYPEIVGKKGSNDICSLLHNFIYN